MVEEKLGRGMAAAFTVLPLAFVLALALGAGMDGAITLLLYGLGCAAAAIAVARLLSRAPAAVHIALCAALAAGAALLLPLRLEWPWLRYVVLAAGALFTLIVERCALRSGDGTVSQALLLPLGTLLGSCLLLWMHVRMTDTPLPQAWAVLSALGCGWFVSAMLLLNRWSLRRAARAGAQREVPAGTRRAGFVGTTVFLVAAFLLSLVQAIGRWLSTALDAAWRWLVAAYLWLINSLMSQTPVEPGEGNGQPDMGLPPVDAQDQPLWQQILLGIITVVIVLGCAALLVYGIYKGAPRLWKAIVERLRALFGTWADDDAAYHDRSESLLSVRSALAQVGEQWNRFARRFRPRPKLSDFATDAERARFLFRELLRRLCQRDAMPPPGATAREILAAQRTDGMQALSRSYALARYAEEQPDPRDIQEAAKGLDVK